MICSNRIDVSVVTLYEDVQRSVSVTLVYAMMTSVGWPTCLISAEIKELDLELQEGLELHNN